MSCQLTFHEAVDASFVATSEQVDNGDETVLRKPGLEGLHSFFDQCLNTAPHGGVSADGLSMELLEKVFEEQGWDHDMSLKRTEPEPFLESLIASGQEKQSKSEEMSQWIPRYCQRSVTNTFPLLPPEDITEADARDDAEQTLQLAKDMNPEEIQHYINLHMQMDLEKSPGDPAMSPEANQAWWALKNYYKHARDFVVRSSLDEKIAHRCR